MNTHRTVDRASERQFSAAPAKMINLALQGGGAHGAFTWGVLDALLEDGRVDFEAITGASAGAMNAVVLVDGWLRDSADPRAGARAALEKFWRAMSEKPGFAAFTNQPVSNLTGDFSLSNNPAFVGFDLLSRLMSPYQLNPLNVNPLREVLEAQVDFDRINAQQALVLHICATNVKTGRVKVFSNRDASGLSVDALLASACLPVVFQAVEIDGESYWDGGFMGNPAMFPLFNTTQSRDILLVQINPLVRTRVPDTASEIIERSNEISFNASLMMEMRAIEFVQRLLDDGQLKENRPTATQKNLGHYVRRVLERSKFAKKAAPHKIHEGYKRIYMHLIEGGKFLESYGASSKYNTSWSLLTTLHNLGRTAGLQWLKQHWQQVGVGSSIDIAKTFL